MSLSFSLYRANMEIPTLHHKVRNTHCVYKVAIRKMLNAAGVWHNVLYTMVLQHTQEMCPPAGPTPETISDFWQMIWDVKPAVIIMLTKVDENGKVRREKL